MVIALPGRVAGVWFVKILAEHQDSAHHGRLRSSLLTMMLLYSYLMGVQTVEVNFVLIPCTDVNFGRGR
jgi:hypothetical protein